MATSIRSSEVDSDGVSIGFGLVFENTGLLTWRLVYSKMTMGALSEIKKGKEVKSVVHVRRPGGEVDQRSMHSRGSDCQCGGAGAHKQLQGRKE